GPTPTAYDVVLVLDGDHGPVVRATSVGAGPDGLACEALTGGPGPVPWTAIRSLDARPGDGSGPGVVDLHIGHRRHRILTSAADAAALAGATARYRLAAHQTPRARPRHAAARRGPGRADTGAPRRSGRAGPGARRRAPAGRRPRHAAPRRMPVPPALACLMTLSLVVGGATLSTLVTGGAGAATPASTDGTQGRSVTIMHRMAQDFAGAATVRALPAATAPPAPAPPSLVDSPTLRAHEIFGFAPYWALPQASSFDVAGLTTLAFFSVGVNPDGTVAESGPGWVGYQSQALADLVTRAHGAGDRVVLTASCFGQAALDRLSADPGAGARLGAELAQLVAAKNLDGVNIDFEGEGSKDRAGLDRLMAGLSAVIRADDPHGQVTMDTYASSAGDAAGFYDVAGLAPSVDAFFVMAYDMENPAVPSPTAPLAGPGFSDVEALEQYGASVSPAKVILGVPYYGYDWPTAGPGLGDPATGTPTPLSYAQVVALGSHLYWDPTTQTPWTSYAVGTQWHQAFFDDPASLALKAQLVNTFHIAGLGIWALGMEGADPAMLAALRGGAPVVKNLPRGPGATATTSTTTATGFAYAGTWDGVPVTLSPVDPASLAGQPAQAAGALDGFTTTDPAAACLASGPALAVSALVASPGLYAVTAGAPADCATGSWEFTVSSAPAPPTAPPGPSPTTSTTSAPTTSTTEAAPTPTTSTTAAGP
ncbi:MAG TPA: glycosyl hydrolase family 18 protein, partial [Acidimicrobiales bacterium]|nr:glycosyl hydrolase family 18 protein [Acidimicrobiales bacterium]